MITREMLLESFAKMNEKKAPTPEEELQRQLRILANLNPEAVDILTYITSDWGLGEHPYPTQRFILKLVYGIPLDDRPDDYILEFVDDKTFRVNHINQFHISNRLDIGEYIDLPIKEIDEENSLIRLHGKITNAGPGTGVTRRILTYDRFKTFLTGSYNETEFLDFLYNEGPEGDHGRCNMTPEMHAQRIGRQMTTVILRLGRRSGKTSIAQWMAAYTTYRILKQNSPQEYYKVRKDQPIRITLVATAQDQAVDLLTPARAAMYRSSWLRQFVQSDSDSRMSFTTQYALDNNLKNAKGIVLAAAPCSARSIRGAGNIMALLEEYGCFFTELRGSNKSDREIYSAISPSTADFVNPKTGAPEGMMMIISTPLTKEAHMYELESKIWEKSMNNSLVLHLPSYWVSQLISTEKLQDEYARDPLDFQREYEALYLDEISSALDRATVDACRQEVDPLSHMIRPDEVCYMGLDVGLKDDGTSIAIVAGNYSGECRLLHLEHLRADLPSSAQYLSLNSLQMLDIEKVAHRIDTLWNEYQCQKGLADAFQSYGVQAYLKSGARNSIEYLEVNQTHNDRIARNFLATILQKRLIIYATASDWENRESILRELVRLQRIQSSGGNPKIKLTAPRGSHDDSYSALSRGVWLVQENILGRPLVTLSGATSSLAKKAAENARTRLDTLRRQQAAGRTLPGRGLNQRRF